MTDIRELLDGIEADLENPWKAVNVPRLVAALRAVLDLHKKLPAGICVECSDWQTHVTWPCDTVRTITEALGGGA